MTTPVLPDYAAPFKPVPNVTPFTIRDGATMLKKIDYINKYIDRVLIPWINENFAELANDFEEQVNILISQVNAAIDDVINSSIDVQDVAVAQLVAQSASETRNALNEILTGYYTIAVANDKFETKIDSENKSSERYTKTEADSKFSTIQALEDAASSLDSRIDTLENDSRIDTLENIVNEGRLTESYLDDRYVKEFKDPVAVFIGSSNSEEIRGWVSEICTRNGWIKKNFSVGGGGFTIAGAGNFYNQAVLAVADASIIKNNVKFVFVIDASNDTRALADVSAASNSLFALLEATYPNARIVVVPEVFPLTTLNSSYDVKLNVGRIYNQLRNTSTIFTRVEIINNTWLWFWDNGTWEGDTQAHLNAAGYKKLRWFIEQYVNKGITHSNDLGDNTGQVAGVGDVIHSRRAGGIVHTYGTFTLQTDQNTSVEMARVNKGFAPIAPIPVVVTRKSDGLVRTFEHAASGALNLQVPTPQGTYYYSTSHAIL